MEHSRRRKHRARLSGMLAAAVLALSVLAGVAGAPPASAAALRIEVDIAAQHAYVFEGDTMIKVIPVSTGAYDRTPRGHYSLYSKSIWTTASSEGSVSMQYMSRFLGGYGFHAIPRKNGVPLATPLGQAPVSHGCIRMADENAKWVFDNLPIGTPVYIYGVFSGTAQPPRTLEPPPPQGGVPVASGDLDGDGKAELITGAGHFRPSHVRIWKDQVTNLQEVNESQVYGSELPGGVWVAAGDLDGDGTDELITAPGKGGGPHVRVFRLQGSALVEWRSFFAYHPGFLGGVTVAAADVDGDGHDELVTGAGAGGGPHVRVLDLAGPQIEPQPEADFLAYAESFRGGVHVAAGDVFPGSAHAEVITGAGTGGGPHVRVLGVQGNSAVERSAFFAYEPGFAGGVRVGAGNVDGAGEAEIVTGPGPKGAPHVRVLSWNTPENGWKPYAEPLVYDAGFTGGVFVAAGDIDGDSKAELLTGAGAGGGPDARAFDIDTAHALQVRHGVLVEASTFRGGVDVAGGNFDGAGKAELVTGIGPGSDAAVRAYASQGPTLAEVASLLAYPGGFLGGVRVEAGDVDGDGTPELITGAGPGGGPHVRVLKRSGNSFTELVGAMAYSADFTGGVFVAAGDFDGAAGDEIVTGAGAGGGPHVKVWKYQAGSLVVIAEATAYSPSFTGGVHVGAGDLRGSGIDEIVLAPGPGGGPHVRIMELAGATLAEVDSDFPYSATFGGGVDVAVGDVDGTGKAELVTGAGPGGGPHVKILSGATMDETGSFFPFPPSFGGGVNVGTADLAGDARAEILTGAGPGGRAQVRVWYGPPAVTELAGFLAVS